MTEFKQGDRVLVNDAGLEMLRNVMAKYGHTALPNHHGTVEAVRDGSVYITFDDGVMAPYEIAEVEHLVDE